MFCTCEKQKFWLLFIRGLIWSIGDVITTTTRIVPVMEQLKRWTVEPPYRPSYGRNSTTAILKKKKGWIWHLRLICH